MASGYTFKIVDHQRSAEASREIRNDLARRPCVELDLTLKGTAQRYTPDDVLETSINTAIAVGEPLLLTGEPGTGKTQVAYYVAGKLDLPLFHFQAKSTSTAADLLYYFDTVRYFHDASISRLSDSDGAPLNRRDYVEKRALWEAFDAGHEAGHPSVLLVDEIDKAPRDFPNDLLHEVQEMRFTVKETSEVVSCPPELRPLVFVTSNDERRLPDAFLRRCVSHHIVLTDDLLRRAVESHANEHPDLDPSFVERAIECFLRIRRVAVEKPPATGELLAWLQVLSLTTGKRPEALNAPLERLPYLGTLVKNPEDLERLRANP